MAGEDRLENATGWVTGLRGQTLTDNGDNLPSPLRGVESGDRAPAPSGLFRGLGKEAEATDKPWLRRERSAPGDISGDGQGDLAVLEVAADSLRDPHIEGSGLGPGHALT